MGYNKQNGEWADTESTVLHGSAARTSSANGSAVELGDRGTLRLLLDVTAASGTDPTLAVTIETSYDGVTWREIGAFTALGAIGSQRASFPGADRYVRARWGIGGSSGPSFTFSVSGEAV